MGRKAKKIWKRYGDGKSLRGFMHRLRNDHVYRDYIAMLSPEAYGFTRQFVGA